MKITTKYNIDQQIYIKELKIKGIILSIFINGAGKITYNIRYFHDFTAKETYFFENELSENEGEDKIGFIN